MTALGCADGSGAFTGKPTRYANARLYATDYRIHSRYSLLRFHRYGSVATQNPRPH